MSMISYAQNCEDVLLRRLFPPEHRGFYIDVGANNPLTDSVTRHFYERGWRGINVEPSDRFPQFAVHRPRDVNLNVALSNQQGTVTLYEFPAASELATCSRQEAASHLERYGFQYSQRSVPMTTLKAVCDEHVRGPVDFVSIDVEGHERQVLEGGDWNRYRPTAIVIEATRPVTNTPSHEQWEDLLLAAEYRFALFDGLNRFYLRVEDAHLLPKLSVAANVFDDFLSAKHLSRAADLEAKLAQIDGIHPLSLALARKLQRMCGRLPWLASGVRYVTRRVA
jgi:FkbM family methyltransferase